MIHNHCFQEKKLPKKKPVANVTLKRVLAFPTLNDVLRYKVDFSHTIQPQYLKRNVAWFCFFLRFSFLPFVLFGLSNELWRKSSRDSWLSFSRCHGSYDTTEALTTGRPVSVHLLTDPITGIWVLLKCEPIVRIENCVYNFSLVIKNIFFSCNIF